eukprot:SAG11_NODE_1763_length_4297_cov_42.993176_1_plen_129_part_00
MRFAGGVGVLANDDIVRVAFANGSFRNFPVPIAGTAASNLTAMPRVLTPRATAIGAIDNKWTVIVENSGLVGAGFVVKHAPSGMHVSPDNFWMDASSPTIGLSVTGTGGCATLAATSAGNLEARFCVV